MKYNMFGKLKIKKGNESGFFEEDESKGCIRPYIEVPNLSGDYEF